MVYLILGRFINVHLLDLLDGSPHKIPLMQVLQLNSGDSQTQTTVINAQISGSRIALVVDFALSCFDEECPKVLIVWDWRTGEVVGVFFFVGGLF
jgi:hypothetical protein